MYYLFSPGQYFAMLISLFAMEKGASFSISNHERGVGGGGSFPSLCLSTERLITVCPT